MGGVKFLHRDNLANPPFRPDLDDVDDHIDRQRDVRLDVSLCKGMLTDKRFQSPKTRSAVIGVKRRKAAAVAGIPRLHEIERLAAAHFAHDDAVGTHAESRFQKIGHGAFRSGLAADFVQCRGVEFGSVFDDDLPRVRLHDADLVEFAL